MHQSIGRQPVDAILAAVCSPRLTLLEVVWLSFSASSIVKQAVRLAVYAAGLAATV